MGPKLLGNVVAELNDLLRGGIVSKIHQPSERVIVLKIFARGKEERLLISAEPKFPRMHLLTGDYDITNPPAPLRFCAFLRSRITNALIEGITHAGGERIASVILKKKTDSTVSTLALVCELTGKSSNIILIDEKRVVLDAIRYFPPGSSVRAVMPGVSLTPLPKADVKEAEEGVGKGDGSWNGAAFRHYSALAYADALTSLRATLRRAVNEAHKKAERKLANLIGDRKRAEAEREHGKLGELLVANLRAIERGAREAAATDYTKVPPETVIVRLDEKLGPKENADRYFKRAKKAKVALSLLKDRIPLVEEEISYIGSLLYELEAAGTIEDLRDIETELVAGKYLRKAPESGKASAEVRAEPIRRFTSSEGFEILCGKSGLGNDLIVRKYAKEGDVWLHAASVPGSHVLVKSAGMKNRLTDATVREAARIAAWYSKSRGETKAEVVYTEAKNVRKKGSKPGSVTLREYKTMAVTPGLPEEGEKA